jgi:hypothetical protein
MLRSSIYTASVLALSAAAFAQKQELRSFQRVTGPVKNAGVYHLATGTWSRGPAASLTGTAGADIVYNCTTNQGYFGALDPGQVWTATGRLPSTTSPNTNWNSSALPPGSAPGSAQGCQDSYTIDGFQFAYCSDSVGPTTQVTIAFFQTTPAPVCFTATPGAAQGGPFAITNLPGRGTLAFNCWIVTFDLAAQTLSFPMQADGNGAYGANTDDAFAWTFTFPTITSAAALTGPILAGGPANANNVGHPGVGWKNGIGVTDENAGYDGTRFDNGTHPGNVPFPANGAVGLPTPAGESGSDAIADDGMRIEGGTITPGCYFFGGPIAIAPPATAPTGGGPYSNFHMELYAKVACAPPPPGTDYCAGDGVDPNVTTPCPCTNFGAVGNGCASSFNAAGAHITATGTHDATTDLVVLHGTGMNATGNCIFLKGGVEDPAAFVFGDGITCAGGSQIRMRTKPLTAGAADFPTPGDPSVSVRGGTLPGSGLLGIYGAYYRNAAAAFCPPATFNITNSYKILW